MPPGADRHPELTAAQIGSGALPVFGHPLHGCHDGKCRHDRPANYLTDSQGSVGIHLDISHEAPTPVGMKVWAEAEIYAVSENGKIVDFKVKAWDEKGTIGQGTHSRAIIDNDRFLTKCNAKLEG